ncbi:amino acid adenylation domain-containing protein [Kitasatospora sp. NPDC059160]|uniref:non-ribosomal peptide synthetase n=1 Tax=Kitasatospora sp. NPDC059160 TaxID=3346748 RepID=UPI003675549C
MRPGTSIDTVPSTRGCGVNSENELLRRLRENRRTTTGKPTVEHLPATGPIPASSAQQRLWFLDRLHGGNAAYNVPIAVRIDGPLRPEALTTAVRDLVRRHEALRTRFTFDGRELVQETVSAAEFDVPYRTVEGADPAARAAELDRLLTAEARRPFTLDGELLVRAALLRTEPERHVLLLNVHHSVIDGWSERVLLAELWTRYDGLTTGSAAELPPLTATFADHARRERAAVDEGGFRDGLRYWQEQLRGPLPGLDLPTDRPRPARPSFAGDAVLLELPPPLTARVGELCRAEGVTPFMLAAAVLNVVLSHRTGGTDLVVGTPVANRRQPEFHGVVGFFANTVALRTSLAGSPDVRELLRRTRSTVAAAQDHEAVPFAQVVEAVAAGRERTGAAPFQVLCTYTDLHDSPAPGAPGTALSTGFVEIAGCSTRFDLEVQVERRPTGLVCRFVYATELFDRDRVRRLAEHYLEVLTAAVADPDRPVADLPTVSAAERALLLATGTGEQLAPPPRTVPELFQDQAARTPAAAALLYEGEALGYAELNRRANRLAHALIARGAGPERVVALLLPRSPDMFVGLLAVLKTGAVYLPVDPDYPPERIVHLLGDARPVLALTHADTAPALPNGVPQLRTDTADTAAELAQRPDRDPEDRDRTAPLHPQQSAYLIYTSGSTGTPKGVLMPAAGLLNLLAWHRAAFPGGPGTRTAQFCAIGFDASVQEILTTLVTGKTLVVPTDAIRRSPEDLAAWIERYEVDELFAPTSVIEALYEAAEEHGRALTPLRTVYQGGEALTTSARTRAFHHPDTGRRLHNVYGPAETHAVTAYSTAPDSTGWPATAPIGGPIANTRVYLLDPGLRLVPYGVVGEVHLAGAGVARGYAGRPDRTAERFLPDPFGPPGSRMYRTGDLAQWLPDGTLAFLGRADHQVKIRGFRVEPGEIEEALTRHPAVARAAVLAREDRPGGKTLVGYLVPAPAAPDRAVGPAADPAADPAPTPAELRQHLSRTLPSFMLPASYVWLDRLPLTPNGKLDRAALPAPGAEPLSAPREFTSETERRLSAVFAKVLRRPDIDVDRSFFDLGGHSLLATRLINRIRSELGVELPLRALFETPTVAELAALLDSAAATGR